MKIIQSVIKIIYRLVNLGFLFIYFTYKVINSGWIVGLLVIKGYKGENEGTLEYHLQNTAPWHIILLFNLISMTPGSLSLDISEDHSKIYVHLLNMKDQKDFLQTTKRIEKMLLRSLNNRVTEKQQNTN